MYAELLQLQVNRGPSRDCQLLLSWFDHIVSKRCMSINAFNVTLRGILLWPKPRQGQESNSLEQMQSCLLEKAMSLMLLQVRSYGVGNTVHDHYDKTRKIHQG